MGFSIDELQIGTLNYSEEYKAVYKYSQYYLSEMKYINKKLHELAKQPILPNSLPSTFYENCISTHSMITYLEHTSYYQFGGMGVFLTGEKDDKTPFRNLYNKIFNGIASENKLATKWKNEYDLYKAVVKLYPDTIYQYNTYWLGTQSLDVFIPSLNLGIEYQGLQHYKAVEFFGGEERLKAQIDRDCRKKMLCEENGIKLIYWRYDEPISLVLVKRRIEESI